MLQLGTGVGIGLVLVVAFVLELEVVLEAMMMCGVVLFKTVLFYILCGLI